MSIRVEIRRRVPSSNAFVNHRGMGQSFAYRKERDAWAILLRAALRPRVRPAKCFTRVEIISFRNRLLDRSNLVGGCKPIEDLIVRLGYAYDDHPKYWFCDHQQQQVPRLLERTAIIIHPSTPL